MLDKELCTLACDTNVAEITNLKDWMAKVKELDNWRQIDLKCMAQFFNAASFDVASMQAAKCQNTGSYPNSHAPNLNTGSRLQFTQNSLLNASSSNPTVYLLQALQVIHLFCGM